MSKVVLRELRDAEGYRYLDAELTSSGDLVFTGQDLGDGVERFFGEGIREYEWTWTIRREHVVKLAFALGVLERDLLAGLSGQFSSEKAAGLRKFLDDHLIAVETWSRTGD